MKKNKRNIIIIIAIEEKAQRNGKCKQLLCESTEEHHITLVCFKF